MLLHTVVKNLEMLETAGLQDTFTAGKRCGFKQQSVIILWKSRLVINDVQGFILLSYS